MALTVKVDPAAPLVARPALPYLLDTTLHWGTEARSFPVKPTFQYIALAEGRALLLDEFHGYEWDRLQLLDGGGRILLSTVAQPTHFLSAFADDAGARFVVMDSPDAGGSDAVLTLYNSDGTEQLRRTGVADRLRIQGIIGDRVFLRSADEESGTFTWDLGDNTVTRYSEWDVADVNERSGRAALSQRADFSEPRCTLVADVRGPSPVPVSTTCGLFAPMELSPDGRYLLGVSAAPNEPPFLGAPRVIDAQTGRAVLGVEEPVPMVVWTAFLADGSVGLNLLLSKDSSWSATLIRCTAGDCTRMTQTVRARSSAEGPRTPFQLVRD